MSCKTYEQNGKDVDGYGGFEPLVFNPCPHHTRSLELYHNYVEYIHKNIMKKPHLQ